MAIASLYSTMRDKRIFVKVNGVFIKTDFKFSEKPELYWYGGSNAHIEDDVKIKLKLMLQRTVENPAALAKVTVERGKLQYVSSSIHF